MLLKKGDSNPNVKYLQYGLFIMCCNPQGIDGAFGDGTYNAVKKFQSNYGLSSDGIVGDGTWGKLCSEIGSIQTQLNNKGFNVGAVDGVAGENTYNAVLSFQCSYGLDADGQVGPSTRSKLFSSGGGSSSSYSRLLMVTSPLTYGNDIKAVQNKLNSLGYNCGTADGYYGNDTKNAIIRFQSTHGLDVDGIVGPSTWNSIFNTSSGNPSDPSFNQTASRAELQRFIDSAREELKKGFKEYVAPGKTEGDNMNPYGEWYGINGVPWCAMFVSYCANKAGILNTIIPKFKYVPYGMRDYDVMKRLKFRTEGYIPKPGDIFFHFSTVSKTYSHTGIVVGYKDGLVETIEGNAFDAVITRTLHLIPTNPDEYTLDAFGVN